MGTPYYEHAALVQRLRSTLPIQLTLYCPFTQGPITVYRENLIAELVVDTPNLGRESQMAPAIFVEMARLQRAAEYGAALAKAEYAKWKAERAVEFRKSAPPKAAPAKKPRGKTAEAAPEADTAAPAGKAPTIKEVEEYYRTHPDYMRMNTAEQLLLGYAGLFADAKEASRMKGGIIKEQQNNMRGFEQVERAASRVEEQRFEIPQHQPPGPVYSGPPVGAPAHPPLQSPYQAPAGPPGMPPGYTPPPFPPQR